MDTHAHALSSCLGWKVLGLEGAGQGTLHSRPWNSSVHVIGIVCTELDTAAPPSDVPCLALPPDVSGLGAVLRSMSKNPSWKNRIDYIDVIVEPFPGLKCVDLIWRLFSQIT